jgi:hypothetical protein
MCVAQDYLCHYCRRKIFLHGGGKRAGCVATVDHRRPLSQGGDERRINLVAACWDCNNQKGDMTERAFMKILPGIKEQRELVRSLRRERRETRNTQTNLEGHRHGKDRLRNTEYRIGDGGTFQLGDVLKPALDEGGDGLKNTR